MIRLRPDKRKDQLVQRRIWVPCTYAGSKSRSLPNRSHDQKLKIFRRDREMSSNDSPMGKILCARIGRKSYNAAQPIVKRGGLMIPVTLLIALMILTWAAAVVAVYIADDTSVGKSTGDTEDQDYYDAA
ncbi:MAG: hypothetical protein C4293_08225 [Nitrospiraceae bacterium]